MKLQPTYDKVLDGFVGISILLCILYKFYNIY